jgi:CxxC-x17-CxxC domain-containing protein
MSDRTLVCRDCGQEFVFTAGEQQFYAEREYSEPTRCKPCRQARKANQGAGGYSSGGYSSGGGGGYGGNGGGQRQFYPATCSECGKDTEVPFQPTPGKPVYCRECFQARRAPRYSSW